MNARLAGIAVRSMSIRMLIVFWAGSVFLAWACLVGGWFVAKSELRNLGNQIVMDTKALGASRELEAEILAHEREYLLWQATGLDYHYQRHDEHLRTAESIAARLDPYATTDEEREIEEQVQEKMRALRERGNSSRSAFSEAESRITDELLATVNRFQTQHEARMNETVQAADLVHRAVSGGAIVLSLGTAGLLFAGALAVVNRVIRPALAMTHASSAIGQGDFSARAPVLHDDELGSLARTFNNMAVDIADREKNRLQFVAMVVHDLKNPLLAIEMAGRLLRKSIENEQQRSSYLDAIATEVKRLRGIVRDLTDDIQVASGRLSIRKTRVDLVALVRQLVQTQAEAFSSHEIVLQPSGECFVLGDAERIERVVQNLVSNAVKYSTPGTRVTVRVETREQLAVLSVSDEGPGIREEDLRTLFQPFGRGQIGRAHV